MTKKTKGRGYAPRFVSECPGRRCRVAATKAITGFPVRTRPSRSTLRGDRTAVNESTDIAKKVKEDSASSSNMCR